MSLHHVVLSIRAFRLTFFSFIFGIVGVDAAVSQKRVVLKVVKKPATRKVVVTKKKPICGGISKNQL